jgi:predicted metal-dependent hydrolase
MDERFYRGLEELNEERFLEAHEVLEDLWHEYRDVDRPFIQGLIQIAAAFYHLQSNNLRGAVSQFSKGSQKLTNFLPAYKNVSVARLLDDVQKNLQRIQQTSDGNVDAVKYPRIQYTNSEHSYPRFITKEN